MSMQDKVALVTGASRGIGQAVAHELARQGARVVGTATSESGAARISEAFEQAGLNGIGLCVNITDDAQVKQLLAEIKKRFGDPDILVNNAGITRDNLAMRMTDQQWDEVIQTNLSAIFRLTRNCLRSMMKKRWGRIISMGSIAGVAGNPGQANYSAAKAGLIGFSKTLGQEVAARNITVNVVAPGLIDTDMAAALDEQQRNAIMQQVPAGRMGKPEEIAATVAFLASEGAGYITGSTINVNGGMYMQ